MSNKESSDLLKKKRKRDKIDEIINNFRSLQSIFKTEKAQNIFNSLGKFSMEEYTKFFQNLSNKEYKSMNEYQKKNREPIIIDKSKINFDYSQSKIFDNDSISIKDILKTNLQTKGISKKIKENINKIIPKKDTIDFSLYLDSVSEDINNIINSRKELNIEIIKQIIKVYSILIRTDFKIEYQQDNIIIELLKKYLDKSLTDFYNLSLFWLNTEYLACCENKNPEIQDKYKFKRYDLILKNIVDILNKLFDDSNHILINNESEYDKFISNIPLYNKAFIEFSIKYQRIFLENKSDNINNILKENKDKDLFEVIPFLESMEYIYINIINGKNLCEKQERDELRKIMLENFLELTRNKKYFNAKGLEFIFNNIYNISKFEQNVIKDFGIKGFDEIKTLNEEEKEKIEQRFFFYFFLCKRDNENIIKLPSVYKDVNQSIKDLMNPYLEKRFIDLINQNEQVFAEKLINECNENTEEIVIYVIKNIYGNPNYKYENKIEDEKLYRRIRDYYVKYNQNLTKGVIEMSNKIPFKDFFTSYNFIINRIKVFQSEQKQEILDAILERMNSKEMNKNVLGKDYEIFDKICNKIFFYILYYSQNVKNEEYKSYYDLMIKFHLKKLLELKNESLDNLNLELSNLSELFIKDNTINLLDILNIYDKYKEIINNFSELSKEDSEFFNDKMCTILINYINEKIKEENNSKFLEDYYKKLSGENKNEFKSRILSRISEQAKGSLDLITFGDMSYD